MGIRNAAGGENAYFVQLRFRSRGWSTVGIGDDRATAARHAGRTLQAIRDENGRSPLQVRVVSEDDLVREGGWEAVGRAFDEIGIEAQRLAVHPMV